MDFLTWSERTFHGMFLTFESIVARVEAFLWNLLAVAALFCIKGFTYMGLKDKLNSAILGSKVVFQSLFLTN